MRRRRRAVNLRNLNLVATHQSWMVLAAQHQPRGDETDKSEKKSERKSEKKSEKKSDKKSSKKMSSVPKELQPCKQILSEIEKEHCSWPFMAPVNTKQIPQYRKIIKQPMDFSTMKNKLKEKKYKTLDDFAVDARLIFDNCETFNEDESEVGRAGHAMRSFFETRWMELTEMS
nr:bromodomain adjacent to zinc finger domain protein 2B-like [Lytechinus pictus]